MTARRHVAAIVVALALAPHLAHADDPDASVDDAAVAAPPSDASAPVAERAPAPTPAAPPASVAGSSPPPPTHAHRHRRRAHRRRHRAGALLRSRGAILSIAYRYTNIPTEGLSGPTHGVSLDLMPLARMRGPARFVRLDAGAEVAARFARRDATDTLAWLRLGLGPQYPTRWVTPFAMLVLQAGFATRYRFFETLVDGAWTLGLEGGADLRLVGFAGITASLGVGRTVVGEQWSWGGWIRAGVALF